MDESSPAWSRARRILLKTAVMVLAIFCRTYIPYTLIGLWNRLFGGWHSVFFCYAGSRNFISSYAAPTAVSLFRWVPSPIGILTQNGARGLVLAAPVTEAEFLDPANAAAFRKLRLRLRRIAWLMGVGQISLAGILPGVLRKDDVLRVPDTRDVVIAAISLAVDDVARRHFGGQSPPVILLGGSGYVGRSAVTALTAQGYECHVVDPRAGQHDLPGALTGQPALLVDLSRHGAIKDYVPQMWPGLVVLNETFPRPSARDTARMVAAGVDVYHVSGVKGRVRPPLPFGYEDAVPCCAAHAPPGPGEARVVRLSPARKQVTKTGTDVSDSVTA